MPSEFWGCGRLRRGVTGVTFVVVEEPTLRTQALVVRARDEKQRKTSTGVAAMTVREQDCARRTRAWSLTGISGDESHRLHFSGVTALRVMPRL